MDLASVKLILQPLVENAIYHGMEFMDGDGRSGSMYTGMTMTFI